MITVATIVEGHGEVEAVPVLLRRIRSALTADRLVAIAPPIRVHRDRFLNRDEESRRMLLLAAEKCGPSGLVLVLLDSDDDCPAELAASIRQRAQQVIPHRNTSVVLANREFEAWFLASAAALNGKCGLQINVGDEPADPDAIRGAKEWLSRRIRGGRYREVTDQPSLCSALDIDAARLRSRSFRKLCTDWSRFVYLLEPST